MPAIFSHADNQLYAFLAGRSFWGILLEDGGWYTQLHTLVDVKSATERELQWYDDIVATDDVRRIKELWLFCPRTRSLKEGATCELDIKLRGTAFSFSGAAMNLGSGQRYPTYQLIGRLDDPATGACTCYVWDALVNYCYCYRSNVTDMLPWREGGPRIGRLNLEAVGLRGFDPVVSK